MRLSDRCYAITGLAYKFPPVVNAGFIVGEHETLVIDTVLTPLRAKPVQRQCQVMGQ